MIWLTQKKTGKEGYMVWIRSDRKIVDLKWTVLIFILNI